MAQESYRPSSNYVDGQGQPSVPYLPNDSAAYPDPRYYQGSNGGHGYDEASIPSRYESAHASTAGAGRYDGFSPPNPSTGTSQPIYDAVNNAFDASSAAHQLPNEVIAQITEQVRSQVIHSLRAEMMQSPPSQQNQTPTTQTPYPSTGGPGINIPMPPPPPPPPLSQSHYSGTSPASPAAGFAGIHVPPISSVSGFNVGSPANSNFSGPTRAVHTPPTPTRRSSGGSGDSEAFERDHRRESHTRGVNKDDRHRGSNLRDDLPTRLKKEDTGAPIGIMKEDLSSRYGERTRDDVGGGTSASRPTTERLRTDDEETVVEKMWQSLFDGDGEPTKRLHQFLRGVALHLIEELEPKYSLVVSPKKMRQFYEQMKLSDEIYPWGAIFNLPPNHLSSLYSSLSCTHHLVPPNASPYDTPNLPALTPHGFASWMILMIKAHPSKEFDRLSATVREWPVCNADDRKERWPKELSRRLLPKYDAETERKRVRDALIAVGISISSSVHPLPHHHQQQQQQPKQQQQQQQQQQSQQSQQSQQHSRAQPPPPPPPPSSVNPYAPQPPSLSSAGTYAPPPPPSSSTSRAVSSVSGQRTSYAPPQPTPPSSQPHMSYEDILTSSDEDDDNSLKPTITLERERKPYVAKEGMGKIYKDDERKLSEPLRQGRDRSNSEAAEHSYSSSTSKPNSSGHKSSRGRSPSHTSGQVLGRGSGDLEDDGYASRRVPTTDEDRYREYMERERDREWARIGDEEKERERRTRYEDEYRRSGAYPSGNYSGNPALGTGERRY